MRKQLLSLVLTITRAAAVAGNQGGHAAEPVGTGHGKVEEAKTGDRVRVAATAACPTPDDIAQLQKLVEQKDIVGAEAFIAQKCLDLPAGTEFIVASIGSGVFCGRPQGATDCLWMRQSAILERGATVR
ncbi:MAG: hypothetical protein JO134_20465 [Xanthobacteraceae bacterium]|nr:hypothetical protein [Xanthobacteraceae bacterium]